MPSPLSLHADHGAAARHAVTDTPTRPPRGGVFHRVGQQVPRHLLQTMLVADHRQHIVRSLDVNRDVFRGGCRPDGIHGGVDDRAEIQRGHRQADTALDHPRDVEEVFDQPGLNLGVAVDGVDGVLALLVVDQRAGLQHVDPADDRVERRAQLMRGGGEKLILESDSLLRQAAARLPPSERGGALVEREMQLVQIDRRRRPSRRCRRVVIAIGHDTACDTSGISPATVRKRNSA